MKRGFLNNPKKSIGRPQITSSLEHKQAAIIPTSSVVSPSNVPDLALGVIPENLLYVLTSLSSSSPSIDSTDREPSTTAILYGGMKEKILALPAFSAPFPFPSHLRHYRISPVDGVGIGMFATKDFNPGDLIACDRPLLIAPRAWLYGPGQTVHPHDVLDQVINQKMSEADRNAFLDLSNCKGSTQLQNAGILDTNALGIDGLPGYDGTYVCVCKDISRINHSCSPNIHHRWNVDLFGYECHALRPIRANEQITISYLSSDLLPRQERQIELSDKYAFKCTCSCCILPKKESLRSDTRRALLASQKLDAFDDAGLEAWVLDVTAPDDQLTAHGEKIMRIMEEEQCYDPRVWPVHLQGLIKAYCALGDAGAVRKWAAKAAILTTAFTGKDKGWMIVAINPEKSPWWGRKVRKQK